jgi:DNA-binding GntR family transcriptional regulator
MTKEKPSLKTPTRRTLADGAADSLRNAIVQGLFPPGERLTEAYLADHLQVSRAPVREALASLEQEGLVCRTPGGGAVVARLTQSDIEEICTLRIALEVLAVRLAVQRGTEADWQLLEANIRTSEHAHDPRQLAQLDLEFHELILRAAQHSRLLATWLNLRSQIRLILVQRNLIDADIVRHTVDSHRSLLQALRAGDQTAAVALTEEYTHSQYEWLVNDSGDSGPLQ